MCCCGLASILCLTVKQACPKGCTCWFVLSMIMSVVVFGVMLGFQVYLDNGDGEFPVQFYSTFTGVLYAGNLLSFIACIASLMLIFTDRKSFILTLVIEASLIFALCVTLYCIYFVSHDTPGSRISVYTRQFYRERKRAPAFMDYVQTNARITIPIPGNPEFLGCCGGADFIDYSNSTRRVMPGDNATDFFFDVPDSCCKIRTLDCGRNLTYSYHFLELGFLEEAIKLATGGSNKNLTLSQNIDQISARWMEDLERVKLEAENERNKSTSLRFLPIIPSLSDILTPEQALNLKDLPALIESLKAIAELRANRALVKIHVIGCGRIFDGLCSSCADAFAIIQALVQFATIIMYALYYLRLRKFVPLA